MGVATGNPVAYCGGVTTTATRTPTEACALSDAAAGRLFKVLGDPTRLALLRRLAGGPATVSELLVALGDPPRSRVSNHLACLAFCGLVTAERDGRNVTYTLTDPAVQSLVELAAALAAPNAKHLASCTRIGPEWV